MAEVFSLCLCTHTPSQIYEILCTSWKCKWFKCIAIIIPLLMTADLVLQHLESDLFICFFLFVFCFGFAVKHGYVIVTLSAHFRVHSLQSSWSRFSQNRLGHQWLSILWLKERASCCTCYARGVMFLSPWFTQQSIYWRRFKIHYHLVLPRKIVEQHSTIEVNTGLLQKKRWAQILPSSFCLHLCLAIKPYVL